MLQKRTISYSITLNYYIVLFCFESLSSYKQRPSFLEDWLWVWLVYDSRLLPEQMGQNSIRLKDGSILFMANKVPHKHTIHFTLSIFHGLSIASRIQSYPLSFQTYKVHKSLKIVFLMVAAQFMDLIYIHRQRSLLNRAYWTHILLYSLFLLSTSLGQAKQLDRIIQTLRDNETAISNCLCSWFMLAIYTKSKNY